MAGSLYRAASVMIRSRFTNPGPPAVTITPPFGDRAKVVMTLSIFVGVALVERANLHPE
jgi:hypothetical protein